jgi:hypothetical protein
MFVRSYVGVLAFLVLFIFFRVDRHAQRCARVRAVDQWNCFAVLLVMTLKLVFDG